MASDITGKVLKEKYHIIKELSVAKEAGRVYLAKDIQDKSKRIIKISNYDENCNRDALIESFNKKDNLLINLDRKSISPKITDFFIISKKRFVVMEHKIQKTLPDLLNYPLTGRTLRKRYNIVKGLYNTKWGSIYLIKDMIMDNRYLLLKEIKKELLSVTIERDEFKKIALKLKDLTHPALPLFIDFFAINNNYYVVTEYNDGNNLEERKKEKEKNLSEDEILDISIKICDAIEYIHNYSQITLLGSLSPANIIYNDREKIKILNFEIPHLFKAFNSLELYHTLFNKYYTVPEKNNIEPPSDLYSLGVIMHYLITGMDPKKFYHSFHPPAEYNKNISSELNDIVMKALNKNTSLRYKDPMVMKEALISVLRKKDSVKQKKQLLSEIEIYEQKEYYNKAIEAYGELLKDDPRNEDILCKMAFCYENLKNYNKAIEYYTEADTYSLSPVQKRNLKNKIKSNKVILHLKNGILSEEKGRRDKAIENYLELLKFDPNNQECLLKLAGIYEYLELREKALKIYYKYKELVSEKDRKDVIKKIHQIEADKITIKAENLRKKRQYEEALSTYKKALQIDENNEKAACGLALAYEQSDNIKEALQTYINLMNYNPNSPLKEEIDKKINKLSQLCS